MIRKNFGINTKKATFVKLTVAHLLKKLLTPFETGRFITAFTKARREI